MASFLTVNDVEVHGLKVLVRSDLNVPISAGEITDDFRIRAALPTLEALVAKGATVTVCSHLGRPEGSEIGLSLRPIAEHMNTLTELEVAFGSGGEISVFENTRFDPGEMRNDPLTVNILAGGFDLFVQDAFGTVHRAHASTVGVAERLRSVAGPLLEAELDALERFIGDPERPYVVVLGGAKVSDKLAVVESLLPRVDEMLIGGAMCFTFLKAAGCATGVSLVEDTMLETVNALMSGHDGSKLVLPVDVVAADHFAADAETRLVSSKEIPEGWIGMDIGPETSAKFAGSISEASSVFWNGPLGMFEWDEFRAGTASIARAMANSRGFTAVGGGDSVAALRLLGMEGEVSHLSTGGGAGLELLEGRVLPGVAVLERWVK